MRPQHRRQASHESASGRYNRVDRRPHRGHPRKSRPRLHTAFWRISQSAETSRPSSLYVTVPLAPGPTLAASLRSSAAYTSSARSVDQHSVTRIRLGPHRPEGHQTAASLCVIQRQQQAGVQLLGPEDCLLWLQPTRIPRDASPTRSLTESARREVSLACDAGRLRRRGPGRVTRCPARPGRSVPLHSAATDQGLAGRNESKYLLAVVIA